MRKNSMKRMTLGLSAAVLILAGTGFAAERMRADQPETRAEAQARAGSLFDKMDLNRDGKLDQADRAVRTNQMFDRLDTNHDGMISRDEFAAAHDHMMGPGHDRPEHGIDQPGMPDHGMDHMGGEHHGGHHMGHWGYDHRELGGLVMLIMQRADPGHTGTITRDAFVKGALSLFDQADTNHDGVLTPAEHKAAAQLMRQQMHAHMGHHGPDGDMPPPPPSPPAH
jgi:hypothetical protein